jgi:hypothetical protein
MAALIGPVRLSCVVNDASCLNRMALTQTIAHPKV